MKHAVGILGAILCGISMAIILLDVFDMSITNSLLAPVIILVAAYAGMSACEKLYTRFVKKK